MPTPSRFTPEVRSRVIQGLRQGMSMKDAAAYAGISYFTLNQWNRGNFPKGSRISHQQWLDRQEKAMKVHHDRKAEKEFEPLFEEARHAGIQWEDRDELLDKLLEHREREFEKSWEPLVAEAEAAGIEWDSHLDLVYKLSDHRFEKQMQEIESLFGFGVDQGADSHDN